MRCEQLQFELPLYIDNVVSDDVLRAIEEHLPTCPLCRQKLSEYGEIRNDLRQIGNPVIPVDLQTSLLASTRSAATAGRMFELGVDHRNVEEKIRHWLLPLSSGALISAVFVFLFLTFLFVRPATGIFGATGSSENEVAAASGNYKMSTLSPDDLVIEIPDRSPEVNPTGALIALTRSIVRGKMSDEEVVIVADVFGNGLANITEIVDPPKDDRAMRELEKAFGTNPDQAPFLPAKMGRDSDAIRVVLKIQRVDVRR